MVHAWQRFLIAAAEWQGIVPIADQKHSTIDGG
jgi:hypothetical protein